MIKNPEVYIERLIECSSKKLLLLQEYYRLLQKKNEVVLVDTKDDSKVQNDTKSILQFIETLDNEFEIYLKGLKRHLNISSLDALEHSLFPQMKELKVIVKDILLLTQDVQNLEVQWKNTLLQHQKSTGTEVHQIQRSRYKNNPYQNTVSHQVKTSYLDKSK